MVALQSGQTEGEARKQEQLAMLRERRAVYVRRGQRALLGRLLEGGNATADDVRQVVELPPGIDPKLFGAVPGSLARGGIIERAGFVKTARPTAHARPVTLWQLRDAAKARQWLAVHPDIVDDPAENDDDLPLFSSANKKRPANATAERNNESKP